MLPILKSWRARRGLDGTLRNTGSSPVHGRRCGGGTVEFNSRP